MTATAVDRDGYPTLLRLLGLGWHDVVHVQLWRLPTAQLLQTRPGFVWANVALCFAALPVAEWRLGTRVTMALFFACDWISSITVLVGARVVAALGNVDATRVIRTRDAGPSAGAWALVIVTALSSPSRVLRRWTAGAALSFLLGALVLHRRLFDVQHAMAGLLALLAAFAFVRSTPGQRRHAAQ